MDAASVIAEKLMPSVVGISTVSTEYRQSIFELSRERYRVPEQDLS